jgi:predicted regulator of Ras-like GTPase activity (Roadblock/LC7/MglB family)
MSGISVAGFLQLIAMEQKSCLLEVYSRERGKGILVCNQGQLVDADCEKMTGEEAAVNIIAWENVTLNYKAHPRKKLQPKIKTDLMSLLLESLKIKDEAQPADPSAAEPGPGSSLAESLQGSIDVQIPFDETDTAPECAAPADGGPPMIDDMLAEMMRETREALFVGIFDRDGADIAHRTGTELNTDVFRTRFAKLMDQIENTVTELKVLGSLEEAVTQTHNAWVLIRLLSPTHFLAIIVSRKSTLGNARIVANKYASELNQGLQAECQS